MHPSTKIADTRTLPKTIQFLSGTLAERERDAYALHAIFAALKSCEVNGWILWQDVTERAEEILRTWGVE
jgi:hypothetical protein